MTVIGRSPVDAGSESPIPLRGNGEAELILASVRRQVVEQDDWPTAPAKLTERLRTLWDGLDDDGRSRLGAELSAVGFSSLDPLDALAGYTRQVLDHRAEAPTPPPQTEAS
jgi:hypothetical protein